MSCYATSARETLRRVACDPKQMVPIIRATAVPNLYMHSFLLSLLYDCCDAVNETRMLACKTTFALELQYRRGTVCRLPPELHRHFSLSYESSRLTRHFCSDLTDLTFAIDDVKCPCSVFVTVSCNQYTCNNKRYFNVCSKANIA